jgi:hypothetical protein
VGLVAAATVVQTAHHLSMEQPIAVVVVAAALVAVVAPVVPVLSSSNTRTHTQFRTQAGG